MIGRTNTGGGGKLKDTDAILTVTAPAGSTVTATKGGVTLTPTMWVSAAAQWEETALFVIPASKFDAVNPWTVAATINSKTTSATIIIDDNQEYDVDLRTYVFVNGGVLNPAIEWIIDEYTASGGAITQESGDVKFVTAGNNNAVFCTKYPCDLTKFSYLKITITSGESFGNAGKVPVIAVGRNRIATPDGSSAGITGIDASTLLVSSAGFGTYSISAGTYTLNVSSLFGYYYVALTLGGSSVITGESGYVKATSFALFE